MTKVLHITPHLGGGVGKVLSSLVSHAALFSDEYQHDILCLEEPEKTQFVDIATEAGCEVVLRPSGAELVQHINDADIVQLEFWNHPATTGVLCRNDLPSMRLLVWCHVSGLAFPSIPVNLLKAADRFMFTSECSFEAPEVEQLEVRDVEKLDVVSSGVGVEDLPQPPARPRGRKLAAGYFGSLNFSKLHPDFVSFLSAVDDTEFCVRLIGDETNRATLEEQCRAIGRPGLLEFRGYRTDVVAELSELDALVYLLNPVHYGTAENALLEAMAMGVIPIVLGNTAEKHIVEDGVTGIIVNNPSELADAIRWLSENEQQPMDMSKRTASMTRERCTYECMINKLNENYDAIMDYPKKAVNFAEVFGESPKDWFSAFQRDGSVFGDDGDVAVSDALSRHALFERKKGSVFHFLDYFPEDEMLQKWAHSLQTPLDSA